MKILVILLNILNLVNLFSLWFAACSKYDMFILCVNGGTLTDQICVNQIAIAMFINLFIGFIARFLKVSRPKTGFAIIKESSLFVKIMVPVFGVGCFLYCIFMNLTTYKYFLVCFLHALGVFNCSRIIKKL